MYRFPWDGVAQQQINSEQVKQQQVGPAAIQGNINPFSTVQQNQNAAAELRNRLRGARSSASNTPIAQTTTGESIGKAGTFQPQGLLPFPGASFPQEFVPVSGRLPTEARQHHTQVVNGCRRPPTETLRKNAGFSSHHTETRTLTFSPNCPVCDHFRRSFHGYHSMMSEEKFWFIMSHRFTDNTDGEDDALMDTDQLVVFLASAIAEITGFLASGDQVRTLDCAKTTQQRALVHGICQHCGLITMSVGFHPKRRVQVAKSADEASPFDLHSLRANLRKALKVTNIISNAEMKQKFNYEDDNLNKRHINEKDSSSSSTTSDSSNESDSETSGSKAKSSETSDSSKSDETSSDTSSSSDTTDSSSESETQRKNNKQKPSKASHTKGSTNSSSLESDENEPSSESSSDSESDTDCKDDQNSINPHSEDNKATKISTMNNNSQDDTGSAKILGKDKLIDNLLKLIPETICSRFKECELASTSLSRFADLFFTQDSLASSQFFSSSILSVPLLDIIGELCICLSGIGRCIIEEFLSKAVRNENDLGNCLRLFGIEVSEQTIKILSRVPNLSQGQQSQQSLIFAPLLFDTEEIISPKTENDAISALNKTPPGRNFYDFVHWELLFARTLGSLEEFVEKNASKCDFRCLCVREKCALRLPRFSDRTLNTVTVYCNSGNAHGLLSEIISLLVDIRTDENRATSIVQKSIETAILNSASSGNINSYEMILNLIAAAPPELFRIHCFRDLIANIVTNDLHIKTSILRCVSEKNDIEFLYKMGALGISVPTSKQDLQTFDSPFLKTNNASKNDSKDVIISEQQTQLNRGSNEAINSPKIVDDSPMKTTPSQEIHISKFNNNKKVITVNKDDYIRKIQREKFGYGQHIDSPAIERYIAAQNEIIERTIYRLSVELYNSKTHFFFELLQNADDASYDKKPGIFSVSVVDSLVVLESNEKGLEEKDIDALCDIGKSTKHGTLESVGEKGIGFKSVFLVSDMPSIHSNGYHFRFDRESRPIGFIVPQLISTENVTGHEKALFRDDGWTRVVLPLSHNTNRELLSTFFFTVDPTFVLFLKNISVITFEDKSKAQRREISATREPSGFCSIKDSSLGTTRFFLYQAIVLFDVPKADQANHSSGWKRSSGQLSIGVPLVHFEQQPAPTKLFPLFAGLPLDATTALSFAVNSSFLTTTSREDVIMEDERNTLLFEAIPDIFVKALNNYVQSAQTEDDILGVVSFVASLYSSQGRFAVIINKIKEKISKQRCIPTAELTILQPHFCIIPHPTIDISVPNSILKELELSVVHPKVASYIKTHTIFTAIGVRTIDEDLLIFFAEHISAKRDADLKTPQTLGWLMLSLAKLFVGGSLSVAKKNQLKMRLILLDIFLMKDGTTKNLSSEIYFPEILFSQSDPCLTTVANNCSELSDKLFIEKSSEDKEAMISFFEFLGVKRMSFHAYLSGHLVPALQSPATSAETKNKYLLEFLSHFERCDYCHRALQGHKAANGEDKSLLNCLMTIRNAKCVRSNNDTFHKWCNVCFGEHFGNGYIQRLFPDANYLSSEYGASKSLFAHFGMNNFFMPSETISQGNIVLAATKLIRRCLAIASSFNYPQALEFFQFIKDTWSKETVDRWTAQGSLQASSPFLEFLRSIPFVPLKTQDGFGILGTLNDIHFMIGKTPVSIQLEACSVALPSDFVHWTPSVSVPLEQLQNLCPTNNDFTLKDFLSLISLLMDVPMFRKENIKNVYAFISKGLLPNCTEEEKNVVKNSFDVKKMIVLGDERKCLSDVYWSSEDYQTSLKERYSDEFKEFFLGLGITRRSSISHSKTTIDKVTGNPTIQAVEKALLCFSVLSDALEEVNSNTKGNEVSTSQKAATKDANNTSSRDDAFNCTDAHLQNELSSLITYFSSKSVVPTQDRCWLSAKRVLFDDTQSSALLFSPAVMLVNTPLTTHALPFLYTIGMQRASECVTVVEVDQEVAQRAGLKYIVPSGKRLRHGSNAKHLEDLVIFGVSEALPSLFSLVGGQTSGIVGDRLYQIGKKLGTFQVYVTDVLFKKMVSANGLIETDSSKQLAVTFANDNYIVLLSSWDTDDIPIEHCREISKLFNGGVVNNLVAAYLHQILNAACSSKTIEEFTKKRISIDRGFEIDAKPCDWKIVVAKSPFENCTQNITHDYIQGKEKKQKILSEILLDSLDKKCSSKELDSKLLENAIQLRFDETEFTEQEMKNFETGYVGEKIAFTVIKEKFKDDVVLWVNEESETRKPYDIVVAKKDSNRIDYYEVKATVSNQKTHFEMSSQEWTFASEQRDCYHIVRVFGVGNEAKLAFIDDPWALWKEGVISMLIKL